MSGQNLFLKSLFENSPVFTFVFMAHSTPQGDGIRLERQISGIKMYYPSYSFILLSSTRSLVEYHVPVVLDAVQIQAQNNTFPWQGRGEIRGNRSVSETVFFREADGTFSH